MTLRRAVGTLSIAFIGTAMINFLVGALLGGWMASVPAWTFQLGTLHGEINPYGWLTMMIYGMTYAVLTLSTGYRPPRALVGWLHYATAELGIVLVVVADLLGSVGLFRVGLGLQALAPILFLAHLLSAIIAGKKIGRHFPQEEPDVALGLRLLMRGKDFAGADRVGQRGTDAALILYLVGVVWMWGQSLLTPMIGSGLITGPASVLIDYGWIGGTIWSVGLHLLPRMAGTRRVHAGAAAFAQWLWWGAVAVVTVSDAWFPGTLPWTGRILGMALLVQGGLFYLTLLQKPQTGTELSLMPGWSRFAWHIALIFALGLGVLLLFGLDPLSLLALHFLFLGFATTLVYGVGYGLLPPFLGHLRTNSGYAWGQLLIALAGVLLMVLAFAAYIWPAMASISTTGFLAIGGILAALGAYAFVLQWPVIVLRKH